VIMTAMQLANRILTHWLTLTPTLWSFPTDMNSSTLPTSSQNRCMPRQVPTATNTYSSQKSQVTRKTQQPCPLKMCVLWKDSSTSWEPLKDLKESDPVQVAEYVVANKLVSEPAFTWWVPFTLKKRDRIIWKLKHQRLPESP
jgi:DeoR/GlpR family transcriptional regulator of sugar metabolism